MDRRDIPPEDRYGGGQSYRPGNVRNRSPPPRRDRDLDGYNARSPPRRQYEARGPIRGGRSRSPLGREPFRRRSPSPRDRFGVPRGGDSYRTRPRSPLRHDDGPRDDLFRRDNGRNFRDERDLRETRDFNARSPPRFRDRSPGRGSPAFRGRRTPPPGPRRDRSPPRRFEDRPVSRPHSPPRRRPSPRGSDRDYPSRPRSPIGGAGSDRQRLRSPSPRGYRPNRDFDSRGRESSATSRKSSPPVHASRLALVQDLDEPKSGRPSPRAAGSEAAARPPPRSPEPRKDRDGDYILNDAAIVREEGVARDPSKQREPPLGPSAERAPPTGPGGQAATRPSVAPPAGPRGDIAPTRGGFVPRGRGGYNTDYAPSGRGGYNADYAPSHRGGYHAEYSTPSRGSITATFRGGRGGTPAFARGTSYDREAVDSTPRSFASTTPRPPLVNRASSISQRFDVPESNVHETTLAHRASLTTSQSDSYRRPPTGPSAAPSGPAVDRNRDPRQTHDSVHPALRGLSEIIPNGKKIPPVADHSRLNKLEEEAERLRKAIYEKEASKRRNFREWERLLRESNGALHRSDIADGSVRAFEGEVERAGSAF